MNNNMENLLETVGGYYPPTQSGSLIKRLLRRPDLNQSVLIRIGNSFEDWLNNLADIAPGVDAITTSEYKQYIHEEKGLVRKARGNKDVDILFAVGYKLYYRECKCNLNLDSEKAPKTAEKVREIHSLLERLYPEYEVDSAVVTMSWDGTVDNLRGVRVEYINEYLALLGDVTTTKRVYEETLVKLGKAVITHAPNN